MAKATTPRPRIDTQALSASLDRITGRIYEVKNLCESVRLAAYSDGRAEQDHATEGSMRIATRELQRIASDLSSLALGNLPEEAA